MDLSGLIFVALAVAWAVYLIPKALRHHEDVARARTVDSFSEQMRVVARREPVSAKAARLVVSSTRSMAGRTTTSGTAVVESDAPAPDQAALPSVDRTPAAEASVETPAPATSVDAAPETPADESVARPATTSRAAARRAAQRRRRVLLVLLVILAGTAGVAAMGRVSWVAAAVPAAVVVAWLVLCRVMVTGERARAGRRTPGPVADDSFERTPVEDATPDQAPDADETDVPVAEESAEPVEAGRTGLWDPLPMTLPTYVSKPKATKRTVRTIDLDDSDVWTSGRTEVDAALAREADAERPPVAPEKPGNGRRAVGS